MRVKRVGFVGVRTDRVDETTAFFRDVLGLPAVATREEHTISQMPTGAWDVGEVFGADFGDARLIPDEVGAGIFVAFFVDDLEEARREVVAAGHEIIGETTWAEQAFSNPSYAGVGWFFARGPDGNVYVFQQVTD